MRRMRAAGIIGSALGRATALSLALLVALGAGWLALDDTHEATGAYPVAARTLAEHGLRIVQANIKNGMAPDKFQADVQRVYSKAPDFVTFNEVPTRRDDLLAPTGYAMFRTPGTYTGETPVAWNTERWTALRTGTYMISNKVGKTAAQKINLGVRYANWVTAQEKTTGQIVSVIATHFAPPSGYGAELRSSSYKRLGALMADLGQYGPVFAGGDFNVAPRAADYPRSLISSMGMQSTYDITGKVQGTYYGKGAVIDFIYLYNAAGLPVTKQQTAVMNSDHRMLIVDIGAVDDSSTTAPTGTVVSDPATDPRAAMVQVRNAIRKAPAGASVHLYSKYLDAPAIFRAIRAAHARGVHVQVITGNARETVVDRRLGRILGHNVKKKSWALRQPRWGSTGLSTSGLLASASGDATAVRIDLNRALTVSAMHRRMSARTQTNHFSYDRVFIRFFHAVGRTV